MKTLKLIFAIILTAFLTSSFSQGQSFQKDVLITMNELDFGEGIGIITGSVTYHLVWQVSKEGKLERVHWNTKNVDIYNETGDKVQFVDVGTDTYGILWAFFNAPNVANEGWPITWDLEDYWWNDIMPAEMPEEGTFANLSFKFIVKGFVVKMGMLVQLHLNANGDITADVYKNWAE